MLALTLSSQATHADEPHCEDWWFARNLIFDRAGYCFATPLGRALFDNRDCTTSAPRLSDDDAAIVARIRALETEYACAVDTTRTALDDPGAVARYRMMDTVPVRDIAESGCIGYRGAPIALANAARPGAPVIASITPGMSIGFAHFRQDGFDYVMGFPKDGPFDAPVTGWAVIDFATLDCDSFAG
jgi:hypothetical protein